MEYLHWKEENIQDDSAESISRMYDNGFVFTRIAKGIMHQTRSVRIDLSKFELSSENRRILRKGEKIILEKLTIPYSRYTWELGKLAKDFYETKAGGAFSANKIKEIISTNQNFNCLLSFSQLGYAICYENSHMIHYSYPFYDLEKASKDMGMIMMVKTIAEAQTLGMKYIYLGSLQRSTDVYKLQFSGIEWFDGQKWSTDIEQAKEILEKIE
jgi:arginyl-tRNA--protein-N-Asp/Glu arginylyltransferase